MVRLTLDVIAEAPQVVDPNNDRAIILRGLKLGVIENLGITRDQYGCIDLCDNEIIKVSNIPKLTRLRTLLLANNAISRIASDAFDFLPQLTSLVLTHNRIAKLAVLLPVGKLKRLQRISLIENPVTSEAHYRWFLIHLLNYSQEFRFIDCQRITRSERLEAKEFFQSDEGLHFLSLIVPEQPTRDVVVPAPVEKKPALAPEMLALVGQALAQSKNMDELIILERALKTGEITDEVSAILGISNHMQIE